jgi:hypothetical protein
MGWILDLKTPPNTALEPTAAPLLVFAAARAFLNACFRRAWRSGSFGSAWVR